MTETILDKICKRKREHVRAKKQETPLHELKKIVEQTPPTRGFINKIQTFNQQNKTAIIAEVKKASPSKGVIRKDFDPVKIAQIYERSGAACISVLTDEPYFQGKDDYLREIGNMVNIPLLRKDFMIDTYQIYESRALGADCILLIMAALDDKTAKEMYELATKLGMDSLIEIHNMEELERAIKLKPKMIGVNNRNLKTLEVDINTGLKLAKHIPDNIIKIAESGISTNEQIKSFKTATYNAFLIGESIMRQKNIKNALKSLTNNRN